LVIKELTKDALEEIRTLAIYGDIGEGKTSLAYSIINKIKKDKEVFFLKYPNPKLIEKLGYESLDSLELIENIENCILYIDEPQLHFRIYDKRSNGIIGKICSLARQKNIILIISTSDTRVFTKHNESYFDAWCIKNLDYSMVKRGSKIKKILENSATFDPSGIILNKNEFIFDRKCKDAERSKRRISSEFNGKYVFEMEDYFTERHSKPYKDFWEPKDTLTATPTAKATATDNAIARATPSAIARATPSAIARATPSAIARATPIQLRRQKNTKKVIQITPSTAPPTATPSAKATAKPFKTNFSKEDISKLAWGGKK
jgi:hypothetical protein